MFIQKLSWAAQALSLDPAPSFSFSPAQLTSSFSQFQAGNRPGRLCVCVCAYVFVHMCLDIRTSTCCTCFKSAARIKQGK